LTVYAALGPLGLISCQLHSWDSPFRAFPFQQAVPLSRSVLPCGLESPGRSWPSRFARHGWPPIGRGQDDIARYDVCSCQRRRWSPTASLSFQRSFDPAPARSNLAVGSAGLQSPVAASVQAGNPARHQHPELLLRSEAFLLLKVRSRHESGCPTRDADALLGFFPSRAFSPPVFDPVPRRMRAPEPPTSYQPAAIVLSRPWQPLQAEARRNYLNHRVSNNGKIGWSLSGLPALLGFLTSSASLADLEFPATRDYLFSSGETP